jgi:predicted permease
MLRSLGFDLRYALRRLSRTPGQTAVVVLSLSVGIGAATTMLSLIDSLFFRPFTGLRAAEQVVGVGTWVHQRVSYPDFVELRDGARSYDALGAFAPMEYTLSLGRAVVPARGLLASSSLFHLLNVTPLLGRGFVADEDRPGATPVALVTEEFWRRYLGDPGKAIGSTFRLGGRVVTVIGVLRGGFTTPDLAPADIVLPITNAPWLGGEGALTSRDYQWIRMVGRLKTGTTPAAASAEATTILRRSNQGRNASDSTALARTVVPVRQVTEARRDPNAPTSKAALWLTALAFIVFLIACANAASVLIARAVRDRGQLAVQTALGMSRGRLCSQWVFDALLLVAPAVLLATWVAHAANFGIASLLFGGTVAPAPLDERSIVPLALAAALAVALCVAAQLPRAFRLDPSVDLGSVRITAERSHRRVLRLLLAVQMGLAVLLICEALIFSTSLRRALSQDLGVDRNQLLIADVDLHAAGMPPGQVAGAVRQTLGQIAGIKGVSVAGFTNAATAPGLLSYDFSIPGKDDLPRVQAAGLPGLSAITPGFLKAIGLHVLLGRELAQSDVDANASVLLVSERFSKLFWPGENPIGKCVKVGGADANCAQVIGVVNNRRQGVEDPAGVNEVYLPLGTSLVPAGLAEVYPGREVAIRITGDPGQIASAVRAAIASAIPELINVRVRSGSEYFDPAFRLWRLAATIMSGFGLLAILLASIGVFGSSAHLVAQRRHEFAIRQALGARAFGIARLILKDSLKVAAIGAVIGLVVTLYASRFTRALVFGVSTVDPVIYATAGVILLVAALAATIIPAVRAALSDPVEVLRS